MDGDLMLPMFIAEFWHAPRLAHCFRHRSLQHTSLPDVTFGFWIGGENGCCALSWSATRCRDSVTCAGACGCCLVFPALLQLCPVAQAALWMLWQFFALAALMPTAWWAAAVREAPSSGCAISQRLIFAVQWPLCPALLQCGDAVATALPHSSHHHAPQSLPGSQRCWPRTGTLVQQPPPPHVCHLFFWLHCMPPHQQLQLCSALATRSNFLM
mmetsp:Transcript_1822/g.3449  ORF Transcript_1822/g.3449 Transcript_1822/m.3449 type:complete len:213 (+) Transcript_1822:193-831(+)